MSAELWDMFFCVPFNSIFISVEDCTKEKARFS